MSTTNTHSLNLDNGKDKYNEKICQLIKYVRETKYLEPLQQIEACKSFELSYLKFVFRNEYRKRFYNFLYENITTCSNVTKHTLIPQKYLCECKKYYEDRGMLKVVGLGICPVTKSKNVQFLSTNPNVWNDESCLPKSNQLKMF